MARAFLSLTVSFAVQTKSTGISAADFTTSWACTRRPLATGLRVRATRSSALACDLRSVLLIRNALAPADRWLNRWNPFTWQGLPRLTYNVSYTSGPFSIDALYKQAQELGYATLSYMNVFEYGMNVLGGAKGAPVTPKPDDYRNATLCE